MAERNKNKERKRQTEKLETSDRNSQKLDDSDKPKPLRERAARALCDLAGHPANTQFEGGPMWKSYLPEVDAVLQAVLSTESSENLKDDPEAVELKTPS